MATPLGNLGDISQRAVKILNRCPVIFAEDTRKAGMLLDLLGIRAKKFISLHEHNETGRIEQAARLVLSGTDCCLISDAGTPLVADPGYRLVRRFRQKGLPVIPVPGPCAPVTALMASGLPPYPFAFLGFLPRRQGQVEALFRQWQNIQATLIFFQRKNRVMDTLDWAFRIFGPREFCLARELTKKFEQFIMGTLGRTSLEPDLLQGEITVLISGVPPEKSRTPSREIQDLIAEYAPKGLKPRETARIISRETTGWSTGEIYQMITTRD
ncbi:MAG: 16S rRNA (cytidine(1402)-2'-O)-methyltransferase [Desulfonatronovibrionaceae bacterium]